MLYIHTCHICWMAIRWFLFQWWCSCKDCGFFHCGGRNNWFSLLSIRPYLRQCFFYVVNALQCKISPWYRHWPPNLHNRPTVTWFLWILWIFRYMLVSFALGEEAAWSLKLWRKRGEYWLTRTVWRPAAFPAAMFFALSSKKICVPETINQFMSDCEWIWEVICKLWPTVFLGSMFAILMAVSMASKDGLQSILPSQLALSVFDTLSLRVVVTFSVGFSVSKHMMPSKQFSRPSLLRTLAAWALSAFVKIWEKDGS